MAGLQSVAERGAARRGVVWRSGARVWMCERVRAYIYGEEISST